MFYVCRKDNPLAILKWGHVTQAEGLGEFDTAVYEAKAGPLPLGWRKEPEPDNHDAKINRIVADIQTLDIEAGLKSALVASLETTKGKDKK